MHAALRTTEPGRGHAAFTEPRRSACHPDPVLLTGSHTLANGVRVRLRLPHTGDRAALANLHDRLGLEAGELELRRLLHFDPRSRRAVCAFAWIGGVETLAGFAVGERTQAGGSEVVLADLTIAPGLDDLLLAAVDPDDARVA